MHAIMGLSVQIDTRAVETALESVLREIGSRAMMRAIGHIVVKQTDKRIESEKKDPRGASWPEWSARYAKTRHANQSLLINKGDLQRSIAFGPPSNGSIQIGTPRHYAVYQQEGTEKIPERPFIGLSDDNQKEVIHGVESFLKRIINRSSNA